jgi:hypothetical protein
MRTALLEKARREALEKVRQEVDEREQRLNAARAAIGALKDDERGIIFVELESDLARRGSRGAAGSKAKKPEPSPEQKPTYASLAEQTIRENPQGLRTYEIGAKIGQSTPNANGTLKLLEEQGKIVKHGKRMATLWTAPGVTPVPRIESLAAALVHVLRNSGVPMSVAELREEAVKIVTTATGKTPKGDSVTTELSKLVAKHIVDRAGANEHGALYAIAGGKGGADAESTFN